MLRVRKLGPVRYREAFDLQHALAEHAADDYLLVLEHPAVYTLGVRADPAHILVDPMGVGAELAETDRGGDVTYHGPGQVVVYPIRTLDDDPGAGRRHIGELEQIVIDVLGDLGVGDRVGRLSGYPGVWFDPGGTGPRKVASVGVRTVRTRSHPQRRRSLHGVALNVDCELAMFGHIVPCGINGIEVTSLAAEGLDVSLPEVEEAFVRTASKRWASGTVVDAQGVTLPTSRRPPDPAVAFEAPVGEPAVVRLGERPPLRRLRQAGVDPDEGLELKTRKPPWLRAPVQMGENYQRLGRTLHGLDLVTVCEEAGCPNIYECWAEGTATFMVNGSRCTRACGFCLVDTRRPTALDPAEPERVARAVERMSLSHAVITCVARDDLPDGGAGAMAATVEAIRRCRPGTRVEVLTSDLKGDATALEQLLEVRPDVFNHNLETVARLQRAVRPSAGYARSLTVLARAAERGLVTKSGLMVGLGETRDEVVSALADLAAVGVSIATVGQYLRPSSAHLPVSRWWRPDEFEDLAEMGRALGLAHVESSPLTRSSHHAGRAAEAAGLATPDLSSPAAQI